MLKSSLRSKTLSSERLVDIWAARYSRSPLSVGAISSSVLEEAVSAKGRRRTVDRLNDRLIKQSCRRGAIRTSDLYVCYKDSNLGEIATLAKFSMQVYSVLLRFYKAYTPRLVHTLGKPDLVGRDSQKVFQIPEIMLLVNDLEPLLLEFHSQQTIEEHWQTRSFLSTQLSFSSWFLLESLPKEEQWLLWAYFYFLEEYVSMPWHGVCKAAANHELTSPMLSLAECMLPQVANISMAVYGRWNQLFGGYYNRRGKLDNSGVKHSSLRDFSMFQVYLWLCVLQGNLAAIEKELVVLCSHVYRGIGIPWEMTVKGTKLLADELLKHLNDQEKELLRPYTDGMIQIFSDVK